MKSLCLYPMTNEAEILLRYRTMLAGHVISEAASFKEDAEFLDDCCRRYPCSAVHDSDAMQSDAVLLLDNIGDYKTEGYHNIIKKAFKKGKEIILSRNLWRTLGLEESSSRGIHILGKESDMTEKPPNSRLYTIAVPVIAVLGLGENCSKFEVQLLLKKVLESQGYNAVYVCANSLGSLFGMYTFPDILFGRQLSFQEKILYFNRYVYKLYETRQPDLIIVGFPGGITPLGLGTYNYFGEMSLVCAGALSIDAGIANIYFGLELESGLLKSLKSLCLHKYGIPLEAFCIAAQRYYFMEEIKRDEYYFLDREFLKRHKYECKDQMMPVVNVFEPEKVQAALTRIIHILERNLDAI